ncbi:Itc1p NDAI_0I00850 [Naumovozyma dairenensis CBS 421]|uniref:WAC domain-containing protein n=1 Tax=Naumovozyma dairenensis (strain ATCC 10597 / BCRC 20456 / CBS 421 / NBRC 0211 / NRRL Y-12639) TaxID=1071378 RepID=G0WFU3_NAUDC|nr:hypothetical protein NDAI_0I00850 [Naumovozyma dairenensis CBS 421]CCD26654.1 hypothetical protein NDAI_0I00850 [Naumovozyma dairenensis CBS 421]
MVLYKRKPIILPDPRPLPPDLNIFVWHIDETGEWFPTYEEYIERLDFYTRHHFTCEITGTSCLTFFEALDSEESQFKFVEEKFPLKLREPIARFLHFNGIRRLDALVEQVYSKFKNDFFPGEIVYLRKAKDSNSSTPQPHEETSAELSTNSSSHTYQQKPYIIKEKVQFNPTYDPVTNEVLIPGYSKYMLVEDDASSSSSFSHRPNNSKRSFIADQSQFYRDRSTFTKHLIKCFFKITLQRASTKMGAPWCVKKEYLMMYGLTMDWPEDMLKFKDDEPALPQLSPPSQVKHLAVKDEVPLNNNDSSNNNEIAPVDELSDKSISKEMKQAKKKQTNKKKKKPKKTKEDKEMEMEVETEAETINTSVGKMEADDLNRAVMNDNDTDIEVDIDEDSINKKGTKTKKRKKTKEKEPNNNKKKKKTKKDKISESDKPEIDNKENKLENNNDQSEVDARDVVENKVESTPAPPPVPVITSIVDDLKLPYTGPPKSGTFHHLYYYNENLELIPITSNPNKFHYFKDFQKILQIYQFLNTFNHQIFLSYFNLDQFITSLKCTDPSELNGELVKITLNRNDEEDVDDDENEVLSTWERNPRIRKLINDKNTCQGRITYKILKSEDASDDVLDNFNNNGSALLIEAFVSLLRLFVNEEGEWTCVINDDYLTNKGFIDKNGTEDEDDDEEDSDELDPIIEKCLNYRNVNWVERLLKRQFNNGHWLIILLGIMQDSSRIAKYSTFIKDFKLKVLPNDISSTQLPRQLWRNFCTQLSLSEKVTALWILVDLVTNYSNDIKTAVDDSMDLCTQIRSERFRISRDLKSESVRLSTLKEEDPTYLEQKEKVDLLQRDKNTLDKRVMEHDLQRLKHLGLDRYGNRYFWFDITGIQLEEEVDGNKTSSSNYHTGRIWVQGPSISTAEFILNITEQEIKKWMKISSDNGKIAATREVFGVYRDDSGVFYQVLDNDTQVELVNSEGVFNSLLELTPIQKKIIDETPECLLLDENQWYSIENFDDFSAFIDWFDTWGRKEHDLLRQYKTVSQLIEDSFKKRHISLAILDEKEIDLLKEFDKNEFFERELDIELNETQRAETEDDRKHLEEEKEQETTLEKIDNDLDDLADQIMKLDDLSKTRKNLNTIAQLEQERDDLLARRQEIVNSQSLGARILARSEKKRNKQLIANKLSKQTEILTDLLNYRHFVMMDDTIKWENHLSKEFLGAPLRKNASFGKRGPNIRLYSIDEKLKNILDETSRTSSPTVMTQSSI